MGLFGRIKKGIKKIKEKLLAKPGVVAPSVAPRARDIEPTREREREPIREERVTPGIGGEGIVAGISTALTQPSIGIGYPGAKEQAERLLKEPPQEALRIIKGVVVGAGIGLGASWIVSKVGGPAAAPSVVSKLSTVGGTGKVSTGVATKVGPGAAGYATNTATTTATTSWIAKLGMALGHPAAVAAYIGTGVVSAVGSYPFAGFIKEEALQNTGFAVRTALEAGDVEGAETALEFQRDMLDPGLWSKIMSAVPYVNTLNELQNYFESSRIKLAIDEQLVEDMRIQQETGETENEKWKRIRQEETDQDKAMIDYYNEQRKQMVEWEREAEKDARNEDAAFWRRERELQSKKEEEDRIALAAFWEQYRREVQKLADESRPSNLNFGLL